jgi:hypothetical protein
LEVILVQTKRKNKVIRERNKKIKEIKEYNKKICKRKEKGVCNIPSSCTLVPRTHEHWFINFR